MSAGGEEWCKGRTGHAVAFNVAGVAPRQLVQRGVLLGGVLRERCFVVWHKGGSSHPLRLLLQLRRAGVRVGV